MNLKIRMHFLYVKLTVDFGKIVGELSQTLKDESFGCADQAALDELECKRGGCAAEDFDHVGIVVF
jgi:hypothetical protein